MHAGVGKPRSGKHFGLQAIRCVEECFNRWIWVRRCEFRRRYSRVGEYASIKALEHVRSGKSTLEQVFCARAHVKSSGAHFVQFRRDLMNMHADRSREKPCDIAEASLQMECYGLVLTLWKILMMQLQTWVVTSFLNIIINSYTLNVKCLSPNVMESYFLSSMIRRMGL